MRDGLRIVVLGPTEPPVGGVTRYCRALSATLRRSGATVEVVDLDRLGAETRSLAARAAVRSPSSSIVIDNFQHFWRRRRYAWSVTRAARVPYVLVIHHGRFPEIARGLGWISRQILALGLERSAGVICIGEEIGDAVRALAPRARARVLTPLLPAEPAEPSEEHGATSSVCGKGERYLCFGGALGEIYGIGDILEAFPRLAREFPDLWLVLLLGSFLREERSACQLASLAEDASFQRVRVLEDHPRGSQVIAQAAVYVRCSRADSYGLGIQEARIAGVPVVASRIRGRPSTLQLYEPGNVEELVEAIRRALGDEARADALAHRLEAREDAEANAARTLEFLREVS